MVKFKHSDTSQGQFITVNLSEQIVPDTFEWTVEYLIDKIDLSLFEQNYHNDEKGAAAYSPKILLKIILFCYSRGIISSRKIEKACKENIITKALAEDCEPDHATIAGFISGNSKAVGELFTNVILQCAQLKLITGEMFAIDGDKLPSNASKEWSGTKEDLTKKKDNLKSHIERLIARSKELDKDERVNKIQAPFANTMGDGKERRARSIAHLEKKLEKLTKALDGAEERMGTSNKEVQMNLTDNESALMKSAHGYIQGYNGIAIADSGNQIIVAADAIGSGPESGCFPDMLDMLEATMQKVTKKKKPLKDALVVGDTGYFSEANLQEAKEKKIEVLTPDPQFRRRDPHFSDKKDQKTPTQKYVARDFTYNNNDTYTCPAGKVLAYKYTVTLRGGTGKQYRPENGTCVDCPLREKCIPKRKDKNPVRTLYIPNKKPKDNLSAKMKEKIDDLAYRELYTRRMQIIEPVFSHITYCKGMNRFMLRGKEKVTTQWKLYCIVHNMWKCIAPLAKEHGV